jgi:exonuclease III
MKNGGACIYIQEELKFTTINVQKHAKEQDLEISAVQIRFNRVKLIIISIYRAPIGSFDYFLYKLDYIFNSLHKDNTEFIMCGDINVNYLENNSKKVQLDEMFRTYHLTSTVNFPTRIIKNSATLIDNIFINSNWN